MRAPSVIIVSCILGASTAFGQASFTPLGDLAGGTFDSQAGALSGNGLVVTGHSNSGNPTHEAFRWTAPGGMVALGDLPGGVFASVADGTSQDGSVVVGYGIATEGMRAYRWTAGTGMVNLGVPTGGSSSWARGVSPDGATVVGEAQFTVGSAQAFRWTSAGGIVALGNIPGRPVGSTAIDASTDGSVIVGTGEESVGGQAFRWTQGTGMVGLGWLDNNIDRTSEAHATSADGNAIVGVATTGGIVDHAFRWTPGGGMVSLGDLPGGAFRSSALGINANGTVVVGGSDSAFGREAFVWDAANGMRSIRDILIANGVDMTGWRLETAYGVSDNGLTVAGTAVNPSGQFEAYVAQIPEPSGAAAYLLACASAQRARRRRPTRTAIPPVVNPRD